MREVRGNPGNWDEERLVVQILRVQRSVASQIFRNRGEGF